MQQNRGGGDMKQSHQQQEDRRLKQAGDNQQPPRKCPRCESLNTKFCYYNNYSLSQPRYFCKTCKRYWTQGGTLRNVPVGGGCRKGKRAAKTSSLSSSGENSRSSEQKVQNLTTLKSIITSSGLDSSPAISSMDSCYHPGAGFLSFNPALNMGGSSNLGLLQGFGFSSFGSQQQNQPIRQTQNSSAASDSSSHQNWHQDQAFISGNNPTVSEEALWSINTDTINTTVASSLNPNQWPDLPGYGPPP